MDWSTTSAMSWLLDSQIYAHSQIPTGNSPGICFYLSSSCDSYQDFWFFPLSLILLHFLVL